MQKCRVKFNNQLQIYKLTGGSKEEDQTIQIKGEEEDLKEEATLVDFIKPKYECL